MALMALQFPVDRISGRLKNNSNVNTFNRGQQVLRTFTNPSNPDTADQQAVRTAFSLLTKNWKVLDQSVRDAWTAFAVANPIKNRLGNVVGRTGLSAYVELGSIHYFRTGALLAVSPTLSQPGPISNIVFANSMPDDDQMDFTITHSLPSTTNIWYMIRATPTIISPAVTPGLSLYRLIKGVNSGSFFAAAASPDAVTVAPTKYIYEGYDGSDAPVGIEVQTVNAQGWASTPFRKILTYHLA